MYFCFLVNSMVQHFPAVLLCDSVPSKFTMALFCASPRHQNVQVLFCTSPRHQNILELFCTSPRYKNLWGLFCTSPWHQNFCELLSAQVCGIKIYQEGMSINWLWVYNSIYGNGVINWLWIHHYKFKWMNDFTEILFQKLSFAKFSLYRKKYFLMAPIGTIQNV